MGLQFAKNNALLEGEILDFYLPNFSCGAEFCKGATDLCIKYCYGNCVFRHSNDKNKQMLTTEKIARENYKISQSPDFVKQMCDLIDATNAQRTKKNKDAIKRIRIHSIGDFYSYEYFLKWITIIKNYPEIQFTAYVKYFDVLENYMNDNGDVPKNFNVLLSIYPDTYDKYADRGGKDYVVKLLNALEKRYNAKYYIVCSREFFSNAIKNSNSNMVFCNGGTDLLCKNKPVEDRYSNLFVPNQGCSECLKCYSNDVCPAGSKIYAVLRASSSLANIDNFLRKRENKDKFKILRSMYYKDKKDLDFDVRGDKIIVG